MKAVNIELSLVLFATLIICGAGCRTKHLEAHKSRLSGSFKESIATGVRQSETYQGRQVIIFKDSADHQYSLKIFPLDTISFSLENGFRGRASSIEVTGALRSEKKTFSLSSAFSEKRNEIVREEGSERQSKETAVSKKLEKRSWSITPILIVSGIVIVILVLWWRYS